MKRLPVVPLAPLALLLSPSSSNDDLTAGFLLESLLICSLGTNDESRVVEVVLGGKKDLLFDLSLIIENIKTTSYVALIVIAGLLSSDDWDGLRLVALLVC